MMAEKGSHEEHNEEGGQLVLYDGLEEEEMALGMD
jgi:hypothetical protein